jgi:hypothetical protein
VLIHTTCDLDTGIVAKPLRSEIHPRLLSRLTKGDTIITFNYDTVIEESIPHEYALWTPKGGYGVEVSGITHDWPKRWLEARQIPRDTKSKVQLLKLHGSLNWVLYETSKVRLKPRPYVVRARKGKPVFDGAAILAPGWHKRVDRNPYNALWREARLKLEGCATLAVVGYSLPETDLIAKALFLEVSRSRRAKGRLIEELHVADISDAATRRIIDVFIPALGPKGLIFRYRGAKELADAWAPK